MTKNGRTAHAPTSAGLNRWPFLARIHLHFDRHLCPCCVCWWIYGIDLLLCFPPPWAVTAELQQARRQAEAQTAEAQTAREAAVAAAGRERRRARAQQRRAKAAAAEAQGARAAAADAAAQLRARVVAGRRLKQTVSETPGRFHLVARFHFG